MEKNCGKTPQGSRPLVSVIMAVKNSSLYLRDAIESVLASDYRPLEILIVDGHSTDDTAAIARSYPEIIYVPQNGRGIPGAYNLGLEQARGEFVAFLSGDDRWMPGKLDRQVSYLIKHPEIQGTVGKVRFFLEAGCEPPETFRKELLGEEPVAFIMETLVARKSVFDLVGKFDTAYAVAEDVDWFARAKDKKIPIAVIREVFVHKRIHKTNASTGCPENSRYLLNILGASIRRQRQTSASTPGMQP